jgi:hypothetical protein
MRLPIQAPAGIRHGSSALPRHVQASEIVQDTDGNFYSCHGLYTLGPANYWTECRRLGVGGDVVDPGQPPGHCWTETSCILTTQWCQDRCIQGGRERVVRDWYYCGVCFGGDLPVAQGNVL